MGKVMDLAVNGAAQAGFGNRLDVCDLNLVREAVLGAIAEIDDIDIEQMVRQRHAMPIRRRVRARIDHDAEGNISGVLIEVERNGEPIANWALKSDDPAADLDEEIADTASEAINAFTAVLLQAEAAKRHVARGHADQALVAVDRVIDNARRAWGHVGTLCRDRVLERASSSLAIPA